MHDIIVVGGSFAGLSAALQAVRARRRVLVIDAGAPRNRFAEASHGTLGHDGKPPHRILAEARAQLAAYPTFAFATGRVEQARREGEGFVLTLADGTAQAARRLVLAYGVADLLPPLPGLAECWGRSVIHCPYCHGYEYGGQRLGAVWSGPHTPRFVRMLGHWSDDVALFADTGAIPDDARAEIAMAGIPLIEGRIEAIEHSDGALSAIRLAGQAEAVARDALFYHAPTRPTADLHRQLGCVEVDGFSGPYLQTSHMGETSVPGVFAAGDLTLARHSVTLAMASGADAGAGAQQSLIGIAA